jgi:hypothetical protein
MKMINRQGVIVSQPQPRTTQPPQRDHGSIAWFKIILSNVHPKKWLSEISTENAATMSPLILGKFRSRLSRLFAGSKKER